MERNLAIFKYCYKQMISLKVYLLLIAALFLHTAFYQFGIASYISYFEVEIPLVFSIIFFDVISIGEDNGTIYFEKKAEFSKFKLYVYRYFSCFLISVIFFIPCFIEYAFLFFDKIDIHIITNIDGVQYTNIGVLKVFLAFLVSLMVMTKIYAFININSKNKYISIIIMFAFVILNMVYRYFPFNFMSLFFYGDGWIFNKLFWIGICGALDVSIYFNLRRTS